MSNTEISVCPADISDADVRRLIVAHQEHGLRHYPVESDHSLSFDEYDADSFKLLAAWEAKRCLGVVALNLIDRENGELKSMHVLEASRGRGVGKILVQAVLAEARNLGLKKVWLETGTREASAAARHLYQRAGFRECPPFSNYSDDPESIFMVREVE